MPDGGLTEVQAGLESLTGGPVKSIVLACILLLVAAASGQWLETTLALPDSFGGVVEPGCLAVDSIAGLVYVGGGQGGVSVIDGATLRRVGRLCPDGAVPAVLWNPDNNQVYCASYDANCVEVYDGASHEHMASVPVGVGPSELCYNPLEHKVYCANAGSLAQADSTVTIIDAEADTVLRTVIIGRTARYLCYNPTSNRVYCASLWGTLGVIDGPTDSVVRRHYVSQPVGLCHNPAGGKVYCSSNDPSQSGIRVFDAAADTATVFLPVRHDPGPVCCNPVNNRVYCAQRMGSSVIGFDGATNARACSIAVADNPSGLCYNPTGNKLYCSSRLTYDPKVTAIDCSTNAVLALIPTQSGPDVLCHLSAPDRVFCANRGGQSVTVIDGAADSLVGHVGVGGSPQALCHNSEMNKVYVADQARGAVVVFDAGTNRAVADVPVGKTPTALCYNPARNQVYCACAYAAPFEPDSVAVIDCALDSVVRHIPIGRIEVLTPYFLGCALLYNPTDDLVFCADCSSDSVTVIACSTGTVRGRFGVGDLPTAFVCVPDSDRVWCANFGSGSLSVLDGATGQPVGTVSVGSGPLALCYDSIGHKVYCACGQSGSVTVLDAVTAQVLTSVPINGILPSAVCFNATDNKVYCVNYGTEPADTLLTVIDCAADTVVAELGVGAGLCAVYHNPTNDKVYCVGEYSCTVAFVDGKTNALLGWVHSGSQPRELTWSPADNRTYVANFGGSSLTVVRDEFNGVETDPVGPHGPAHPSVTLIRDRLLLSASSLGTGHSSLLDASGRKVLDLTRGYNNVSALAPGVYFVRDEPGTAGVHKVTIVR